MNQDWNLKKIQTTQDFDQLMRSLGIQLDYDPNIDPDVFAEPCTLKDGFVIGNRFCVQPMEGWDGNPDGSPSIHTFRRWNNFGASGAKLVWGGEAAAVSLEGRGSPRQLWLHDDTVKAFRDLRESLVESHEQHSSSDDLLIGLQLTHAGRFSRPNEDNQLKPVILYHHDYLDKKVGIDSNHPVMTDSEIETLITRFAEAAEMAVFAGFDFVDIKHCHGYLGHEFLSAVSRPGPFGGSLENRTRFLKMVTERINKQSPELRIGVRLSAFDFPAFEPGQNGTGVPVDRKHFHPFFGGSKSNPGSIDLTETMQFITSMQELGIELLNVTGGSPYYVPHIQRPTAFPTVDGYQPPEHPLVGVARHFDVTAEIKNAFPEMLVVGSAYSYLQEWLAPAAFMNLVNKRTDFIGLGRQMLCYPEFPRDVLEGKPVNSQKLCRTLGDCTNAPRAGLVSGCYPFDDYYKSMESWNHLRRFKQEKRKKIS